MVFTMISLPYRRPITSVKHEDLVKILEPYFGRRGSFIGADWGPGWDDIIQDLHNRLVEDYPDYSIVQVKEKFSTLRYYVEGVKENGHMYIAEAENRSAETCEECGRPGTMREDGYWLVTLCEWDRNVRRINIRTTRIRRAPYYLYWKIRFAINRWRLKREVSAKNGDF